MGKRVDLVLISSLYSDPDEAGKSTCIRKNIRTKMNIDVDHIDNPTQIYNSKGKVLKTQCKVNIRDIGPIIVNYPYEYIKKLKDRDPRTVVKGFRK